MNVLAAVGEYLTEQNLRFLVAGAGSGALVGALVGLLRRGAGMALGVVAPALGFFVTEWWLWPSTSGARVAATVVVGVLAGAGYERLARSGGSRWLAPLVLLACLGGVWLAVPENDPSLVVVGVVLGLALVGRVTDPGVGYGLGLAVAWAVLLGAVDQGYSFDGGLLCLAPLVAVPIVDAMLRRRRLLPAWPTYVIGAGAISFVAARWVGVAPDATWARVAVVGAGAGALAALTRR